MAARAVPGQDTRRGGRKARPARRLRRRVRSIAHAPTPGGACRPGCRLRSVGPARPGLRRMRTRAAIRVERRPGPPGIGGRTPRGAATDPRGPERRMVCVGGVGFPRLRGPVDTARAPKGPYEDATSAEPVLWSSTGSPPSQGEHRKRRAPTRPAAVPPSERQPPRRARNPSCHRSSSGAGCQPVRRDRGQDPPGGILRGARSGSVATGRHERLRWP